MSGYVAEEVRQRIREQADNRCGYCLNPQHLVLGTLEIEHLIPRSRGGSDEEDNLWLACRLCNSFKAGQVCAHDPVTHREVALFNPRKQPGRAKPVVNPGQQLGSLVPEIRRALCPSDAGTRV